MACRDPSAFVQEISKCATPFEGVAKCPQYVAATKTHGAKCLTLPTFEADNAPPFGLFACRNATGEMATLCKAAGFPVQAAGAGAGAGADAGVGSRALSTITAVPGAISDAYSGASTGAKVATLGGLGLAGLGVAGEVTYKKLAQTKTNPALDEYNAAVVANQGNEAGLKREPTRWQKFRGKEGSAWNKPEARVRETRTEFASRHLSRG